MPILDKHNIVDFHNYIQRKVREAIPNYRDSTEKLTANGKTSAKYLQSVQRDIEVDKLLSTISKRITTLLDIAINNNIQIKVKINGTITNLASLETLRNVYNDSIKRCISAKINYVQLSSMTDKAIGLSTAESFLNPISRHNEKRRSGACVHLLVYSYTHRKTKGIIFPSNKVSKEN